MGEDADERRACTNLVPRAAKVRAEVEEEEEGDVVSVV